MLEYLVTLALGIWLGVSVFLYIACAWVEDKLDLPSRRDGSSAGVSEGASGAHARLKRLVARAAEEAATLPALRHRASIAPPSKDFRADTYEDLLATAILNKVIDAYQQQECGSSGVHSASDSVGSARAPTAGRSRSPSSHEPFSHDDGSQSDSSGAPRSESGVRRGRPERGDRTLLRQYSSEEERLVHQPRATAAHSTRHDNPVDDALANIDFSQSIIPFPEFGRDIIDIQENDDICFGEDSGYEKDNNVSNGEIHAVNNAWEENWLFQKRRIKTPQAVPVPMLVPNSTADFRALIGDRDAEDTTDLSELGSDSDVDDDDSITTDLKQVLVSSRTLIGEKNSKNIDLRNDDISVEKDELDSSAVVTNMFNGGNESIECGVIPYYKSFNGREESQNTIGGSKQKLEVEEYGKVFIDVNSGPLTKTEFTVSEIHRVSNEMDDTNSFIDDEDNHVIKGNDEVENLNGSIGATDEFDIEMKSLDTSWSKDKKDVTEATNFDVLDAKEDNNTLNSLNHQKESEYTETIAMPVQRHDDSLRRDYHARAREPTAALPAATPPTAAPRSISNGIIFDTKYSEEDLSIIPGSIADRERKKWLNSVPMPNNPYSAEAIKKRLNSNSTSAIFDILTSGKDIESKVESKEQNDNHIKEGKSPNKILKDVLAEEVPQYKRYGRDYYINEAKKSTGARKRNADWEGGERPLSTSNRSQSLEQFNADDNTSSTLPVTSLERKDELSFNKMNKNSKEIDIHLKGKINADANIVPELVTLTYKEIDEDDIFLAKPVIIGEDEADTSMQQFVRSDMDVTGDILQTIEDLQNEVDAMIEHDICETNDTKHIDISSCSEPNIDSYEYSASSLDDSVKVYNVKTGEIISQKHVCGLAPTEISGVDNKISNNDMIDNNSDNVLTESVKSDDDRLAAEVEQKHMNAIEKEIMNIENENYDDFKMPKVKDLAKKFFNNEKKESIKIQPTPARRKMSSDYELEVVNKNPINKPRDPMHMHSLTARSISKEFREELKMSMPTITKLPGGVNQLPEGTEDAFREERSPSPVPEPGTLKNKLAFFESLRSKN